MSLLHRQTPTLRVFDTLGQPVRTVAYYKHPDPEQAVDTPTRVTANQMLRYGRVSSRRDPRLFARAEAGEEIRPNFIDQHSLSGRLLLSESVDAGWRLSLWNATGQPHTSWDSCDTHTRYTYDEVLHPLAVYERSTTEAKDFERCVSRTRYADQSPHTWARNQCGQPIQIDDSAGSLHFRSYSLQGAPLSETRQFLQELTEPNWSHEVRLELEDEDNGATTNWCYSALGEALSQTDAAGNTQFSVYDVAGLLRASHLQLAGQPAQGLVSALQYNAFGQIASETAGNGVLIESTYCPQTGRQLRLTAQHPDKQGYLQDLTYEYDPVGNVLRIDDEARPVRHCANQRIEPTRRFVYDSLDQLVSASGWEVKSPNRGPALPGYQPLCIDATQLANYIEHYTYDAAGNLQAIKHVGAYHYTRRLSTANGSNRSLLEEQENHKNHRLTDQQIAASFDANGNLLRLQVGGPALQWNRCNQLCQVSPVQRENGQDDTEQYFYDVKGQRVRKVSTSLAKSRALTAEVRYLPGLEIRTNSATGEVLHVISAPAGRSSVRVLYWQQVPSQELQNQQLRYSLSDHLGSNTLELDAQANLLNQEGYFPYGGTAWWVAANKSEAKYKTIRYSGKERDATGLYYYGFRCYAPWLGRWINPDPAEAIDGLNLFKMVRNNPLMFRDHNGLDSKKGYLYLPFAEKSIYEMAVGFNIVRALNGKQPYEVVAADAATLRGVRRHWEVYIKDAVLAKKSNAKWNKALDKLRETIFREQPKLDDLSDLDGERSKLYILGHGGAGLPYIASGKSKILSAGRWVETQNKLESEKLAQDLHDKKLPKNFQDFRLNACEGADASMLSDFSRISITSGEYSLGWFFSQALRKLNYFSAGLRVVAYHGKGLISDPLKQELRFDHQKRILRRENLLRGPTVRSRDVRKFF